ncbi:MAG TPA: leucine-rich repeat protein [Candidatus Limihabitans stercoravium]|nr:leucine-rich repeat protein [Candidatus Limihabitans stercoravium]
MKKHFIALLSMMMCFVLSVGIFTACDTETEVPKKYTISFYDGDELVDTIETYGNEEISMPAAPKKEGFTFKGWFSDKGIWKDELTKDTFVGQVLTEDVNVYAYYLENETPVASEYTITFYIDGEAVDSIETSGNERLTLPVAPEKDDHTFEGWFFDNGTWQERLTANTYEETPLTEDVSVYAYYKKIGGSEPEQPQEYTVIFDTDGGTYVSDMIVSVIDRSPETTKDGYEFEGWYTDKTFSNKISFPYEVTEDLTLYAKWTQSGSEKIVFSVDANGVLTGVSGLSGSDITVEIPSEVNGITVTEIGKDVFKDNKNVGRLIIPDSVTKLGYRMCSGCTALSEVRLPAGLTVIPDEAFDGCSSLRTVNFPDTLKEIRSDAFCGTDLTEFIAPDSLTNVWSYAFKDCAALSAVELKNVRGVGDGAFENCTALRSIRLSDKMTELSDHIFDGCSSLADIDMPDNPIAVSFSVFNGTAYYNEPSNWEKGVLYVDSYLIAVSKDFAPLTEYTVKDGTIVIADDAFSGVGYSSKLKKMTLPTGLYRIGQYAFSKLFSLTEINIPDTVRSIGYGAFSGTGYDADTNYINGGLYIGNWLVAVNNVAMTSFTVQEGTVGVADGKDTSLFPTRAQKITVLELPSSLRYIGSRSFARLRITELRLPSELQTLGNGAFASCSALNTVNLGDCSGLESIGEKAFSEAAISEITIPESVVSVGEPVFNNNTVDLTVICEVAERPEGWDPDWSYTYRQGTEITVEWKNR